MKTTESLRRIIFDYCRLLSYKSTCFIQCDIKTVMFCHTTPTLWKSSLRLEKLHYYVNSWATEKKVTFPTLPNVKALKYRNFLTKNAD